MAFILKDQIFSFFGKYAKISDTSKDGDGKGIWERYQEAFGEDYDDSVSDLVDNLLINTIEPATFLNTLMEMRESSLGYPLVITDTEDIRRKMIQFHNLYYRIKGTKLSFQLAFSIMGMTSTVITELADITGFDSDTTLDDVDRTFDGVHQCCGIYTMDLLGALSHDQALEDRINRVNNYLKPLNAVIREITYNTVPIVLT